MLQSLDTLIAFVVIMTIISLFVTILVQMVSAALSLRGKNLANALALTFQTIDPTLASSAHQLAAKILSDPILSDSTMPDKDRGTGTGITSDGPWSPKSLSRDAMKLASAIRPDEVYGALKKIADGYAPKSNVTTSAELTLDNAKVAYAAAPNATAHTALLNAQTALTNARIADTHAFQATIQAAQAAVTAAEQALAATTTPASKAAAQATLDDTKKTLAGLYDGSLPGAARSLLAALGAPTDAATLAADKLSALTALSSVIPAANVAAFNSALTTTSGHFIALIETEKKQFDGLFSTAQDRAQQWFTLNTRIVTIIASILIAFTFQLDAVEIFHHVSTSSAARAALVANAEKVVKMGSGILEDKNDLITKINAQWVAPKINLPPDELKGITNTTQLEEKLIAKAGGSSAFDKNAFNTTVTAVTDAYYKEQSGRITDLTKEVNATGYDLFPKNLWRWETHYASADDAQSWWPGFISYWRHGFGMFLLAGLLTLGAPYWYNLLRTLSSLRPAVAQLIGEENTAAKEAQK